MQGGVDPYGVASDGSHSGESLCYSTPEDTPKKKEMKAWKGYVSNLAATVTAETLESFLKTLGFNVKKVAIQNGLGSAIVDLECQGEAKEAMEKVNCKILEGQAISLLLS